MSSSIPLRAIVSDPRIAQLHTLAGARLKPPQGLARFAFALALGGLSSVVIKLAHIAITGNALSTFIGLSSD